MASLRSILFGLAGFCLASCSTHLYLKPYTAQVEWVYSCDTYRVWKAGWDQVVLANAETPKRNTPEEVAGRKAVEELLLGETVTLISKGSTPKGEWLCEIILPDGRDLGTVLIRRGLAQPK